MGALYGIISKISPHKIIRNEDKCIGCSLCTKSCPMNIEVSKAKEITSAECINCQLCTLSCPKKGALETRQSSKVLKPSVAGILVLTIFFGGIALSRSLGYFDTLPKAISAGSTLSIDEIKGYMSIKEVSEGLKIDLKELYKKLNLTENVPENTKLKDIKNYIPDFSVEDAKDILEGK